MDAKRLSVLNQICYKYTKDRDGSAMTEAGTGHFSILKSYEVVLDEISERVDRGDSALTPAVRLAFFQRAIWHYTTVFDACRPGTHSLRAGGFIAPADRRRYFNEMRAHFIRYLPPDYHYPGGFRGIKYWLIKIKAYRAYSILYPVNKLRVRASPGGVS
jgi:CDP-glycerol glycerophosphotransferase